MALPALSVKAVFDRALEIETPIEREAFLAEACADAPDVRQKVEALLRAYAEADSFLESPPIATPAANRTATFGAAPVTPAADPPRQDAQAGTVIAGKYTLVEPIG